jgi:hypothetical protein
MRSGCVGVAAGRAFRICRAYQAGPRDWTGELPEIEGKHSLAAGGVPFDPAKLQKGKQLMVEDKNGKPWLIRRVGYGSSTMDQSVPRFERRSMTTGAQWKVLPKDAKFDGWTVASGSASGSEGGGHSKSSLPGFGDLWQPSKPKPFDPKRAHVGQRVRDMQGNELEVTRVTNSKQTITLKDEMGEMTIPFGSLPPLDLVPEGGKSWSKGSSVSKAQSDDGVWEVGGYAGKQGSGRWATGPDGVRAVVKDHGGDRDRVATEVLANSVYRELGIEVPTLGATTVKGKDATVSNEVEGATKEGFPVSSRELGAGFMADALLANWDVVGKDGKHMVWA